MGILIPIESSLGQELLKWQQFPVFGTDGTLHPAGNPYVYREFPKMLYRAELFLESGKAECLQPAPDPMHYQTGPEYERACLRVDHFNRRVTKIVEDESQERRALTDGWFRDIGAALAGYEAAQRAIADAAAERAFTDQRMSARAQAEAAAADAATHEHVPDVPRDRTGKFARAQTQE